jgi:hypothetical protein
MLNYISKGLPALCVFKLVLIFYGCLGIQVMTCQAQMQLLGEAISKAQATNLKIGVITEVIHTTQLSSLSVIAQEATVSGLPAGAQGVLQVAQIALCQSGNPASPLGSLASSVQAIYSSAEALFKGNHFCFVCDWPLGRDKNKQCRGIASRTCPMKNDAQAVATGKIKAKEFKALQAALSSRGGKSKRHTLYGQGED